MAKKGLVVLFLAVFAAGGLWAQAAFSVSAGAGGLVGGDFGGGAEVTGEQLGIPLSSKIETPYFGGGGYVFLDATYAELTFAFFLGGGKYKTSMTYPGNDNLTEGDWSITNFNIGLLLKYPFAINDAFSLFPLVGVDYGICLSAKYELEEGVSDPVKDAGDLSALWFKAGVGGDFSFTDRIYLRLEALYGIRLANKFETDTKDNYVEMLPGADIDAKTSLGHGLTAKLAVGFKFF
jgi:hypothetical protein